MSRYREQLDWVKKQQSALTSLLETWSNINSSSDNPEGLALMLKALSTEFGKLKGDQKEIPLLPRKRIDAKGYLIEETTGSALRIVKHPNAPIKVFLAGHMDTVYPKTAPFQKAERLDENTLKGPGVTDMKGGLLVMMTALQALENSSWAGKIGWEVLINPDEEVGSPSSEHLFVEAAKRNHIGLLYEPSFPDGSLVSSRKGSINYTMVIRGKSAHAGRDFFAGRNAISAMARYIVAIEQLISEEKGVTLNVGSIQGGVASNIVPDLAICKFNIRVNDPEEYRQMNRQLQQFIATCHFQDGITAELHETAARGPKPFDDKNSALFDKIKSCASELGAELKSKPSGGVCDGNILSEEGLPTIDTLGVIGGNIHTFDEYVLLNSLTQRAELSALFLLKIASGEIPIKESK